MDLTLKLVMWGLSRNHLPLDIVDKSGSATDT
jgi:hypothetical protein